MHLSHARAVCPHAHTRTHAHTSSAACLRFLSFFSLMIARPLLLFLVGRARWAAQVCAGVSVALACTLLSLNAWEPAQECANGDALPVLVAVRSSVRAFEGWARNAKKTKDVGRVERCKTRPRTRSIAHC